VLPRYALDEVLVRVLPLLLALVLLVLGVDVDPAGRVRWCGACGIRITQLARLALPVVCRGLWGLVQGRPDVLVVRLEQAEAGEEVVGAGEARRRLGRRWSSVGVRLGQLPSGIHTRWLEEQRRLGRRASLCVGLARHRERGQACLQMSIRDHNREWRYKCLLPLDPCGRTKGGHNSDILLTQATVQ
jgi:hypothetical protein